MKRPFIFLGLMLTVIITGLYSQEKPEDNKSDNIITAVSVSGLKRTKPYVIENRLQKFIGKDAESIDTNDVFAIVKSTGILDPLSVEIIDNQEGKGKTLAVAVKEKWTFLPLPIFNISSNGWTAGAALLDTNAFGVRDVMMVMGMFGTGGFTSSIMYLNSPKDIGKFGWNLVGSFSMQEIESTDQTKDQVLMRYNSMSINPLFGLSYALTEHITPSVSIAYRYVSLRDTENPIKAPKDGIKGIMLSPNIGIRYNSWDGFFLNEKNVSLKYNYTFVFDGDDVQSVALNGNFNYSLVPGFRFIAKSGIVFSTPSASPFFEMTGANAAVNILSSRYYANDIAGVSLGLEKYLIKFSQGLLSITAAYQAVYSNSVLLPHQFDHGPVAIMLIYLSKVALPAIGLGGAYNVDKNSWLYAFSVGMQF